MREAAARLAVLALLAVSAAAGDWTRTDKQTMRFTGNIGDDEFSRFSLVFDGSVREIIVNSGGGRTREGIKIGLAIAGSDVKVTVVGKCLSSCANYLFVAGHKREIRGGVVGFHGNVMGCTGRRLSSWLIEFGGLSDSEIAARRKDKKLPAFAHIAMARIEAAREKNGTRDAEFIADRTEGKVIQPITADIQETRRIVLIFPEAAKA